MRWMNTPLVVAIIAVALAGAGLYNAPSRAPVVEPVTVRRCNDASIRTFLSGMAQGAGNFPGGDEYVCREIGEGASAELLVYSTGQASCGSGGCTLLELAPDPDVGYLVLGRSVTVRLPIRVLPTKTHGRYDLVVFIEGGGIIPGYNVKLTYDGKSYPFGASNAPEVPKGSPLGQVVISLSTPTEVM